MGVNTAILPYYLCSAIFGLVVHMHDTGLIRRLLYQKEGRSVGRGKTSLQLWFMIFTEVLREAEVSLESQGRLV